MKLPVAAIATLLLAGCGSRSADQQAAPAATAAGTPAASGGGLNIQPGLWEITMEMRSTRVAGMPEGMAMPQIPPTTVRSCVTPEQVGRANASFLNGGGQAGIDCDYSGVTIAGGRIQGTSTCSRPGMQVTVNMNGSFAPTHYEIDQQMQSTMHGRETSSTNHLVGRRIGECPPGQANGSPGSGNVQDGR